MPDASSQVARTISEKELQRTVIEMAKAHGWKVYFSWSSMHSPGGFPDLVMVRKDKLVFAELKSENGRVSEIQYGWLTALDEVADCNSGLTVYIWRPSDLDTIEAVLA